VTCTVPLIVAMPHKIGFRQEGGGRDDGEPRRFSRVRHETDLVELQPAVSAPISMRPISYPLMDTIRHQHQL
jgi:hypothetical protein